MFGASFAGAFLQDAVYLVPKGPVDDALMLARICSSFMHSLTDVGPVAEHLVKRTLVDQLAIAVANILQGQLPDQLGA